MQSLTAQLPAFPGAEGYGRYVIGVRGGDVYIVTDRDGMSDDWELKKGLDPSDPSDRNVIAKSGYTMLEEYINGLR